MNTMSSTKRPAGPTRVLCVDDNEDMTSAMRMLIDSDPSMRCVGCLGSASDLSREIGRMEPAPDVLLLDATIPGCDPLKEMLKLSAKYPQVRAIVLSGHNDSVFVARVKASGAWGFVSKSEEPQFMLNAVTQVAAGAAWFPAGRD